MEAGGTLPFGLMRVAPVTQYFLEYAGYPGGKQIHNPSLDRDCERDPNFYVMSRRQEGHDWGRRKTKVRNRK